MTLIPPRASQGTPQPRQLPLFLSGSVILKDAKGLVFPPQTLPCPCPLSPLRSHGKSRHGSAHSRHSLPGTFNGKGSPYPRLIYPQAMMGFPSTLRGRGRLTEVQWHARGHTARDQQDQDVLAEYISSMSSFRGPSAPSPSLAHTVESSQG